jgi:hypothetical protein
LFGGSGGGCANEQQTLRDPLNEKAENEAPVFSTAGTTGGYLN